LVTDWRFSIFVNADKGGMSRKTETVKSHSEVLKNPLGDFDEHLTLVDEMMQSLDTLIEDGGFVCFTTHQGNTALFCLLYSKFCL
jgi:hypothetical protein